MDMENLVEQFVNRCVQLSREIIEDEDLPLLQKRHIPLTGKGVAGSFISYFVFLFILFIYIFIHFIFIFIFISLYLYIFY